MDKIKAELPAKFYLEFDGWTAANKVHYVGIFACYAVGGGRKKTLLSICPLIDETTMTAESHGETIEATLKWYGKSIENVTHIVGDNTGTFHPTSL